MYADGVFLLKICLRYRTYLMLQQFDLYRQQGGAPSGEAVGDSDLREHRGR
jgi:hypothetical protein